jgi:hypothetical protein
MNYLKHILVLLMVFISCKTFAQIAFDFEHEGIDTWVQSSTNAWDTSAIEAINGMRSLHHIYDNPESGNNQLSFSFDPLQLNQSKTIWKFIIRHAYNPSSMNNWSVFLVSNKNANSMHPGGGADAYIFGVNYDGYDDTLKLWKLINGESSIIITTNINWQDNIGTTAPAGFRIVHDSSGAWDIAIDTGNIDEQYHSIGTGTDTSIPSGTHFGFYYSYSSSQDRKLWIDDILINGTFIKDTIPPALQSIKTVDTNQLIIEFNEPVNNNLADIHDFYLAGKTHPDTLYFISSTTLALRFKNAFGNGRNQFLYTIGITDQYDNVNHFDSISFSYYRAVANDILVNEIMADPEPPLGMPNAEYIELYNRSQFAVSLHNWELQIGSENVVFPDITIQPNDYLTICNNNDADAFASSDTALPLFNSSLNNTGELIVISNPYKQIISFVEYDDAWYDNPLKAEGGWSLERIDPDNPCGQSENWSAAANQKGGTPGKINSIAGLAADNTKPKAKSVAVISDTVIMVFFEEIMDAASLMHRQSYQIADDNLNVISVQPVFPDYSSINLHLDNKMQSGKDYFLTIATDLYDCAKNNIKQTAPLRFALPQKPDSADIVINEVLFNPYPDAADFVELYNRSNKTIDLKNLLLATRDSEYSITDTEYLTNKGYLCFPGDYLAFTDNKQSILDHYASTDPERIIEMDGMPPYPNESGRVVLLNKWNEILDEFAYNENMHFQLLEDVEGVSLERINYNLPTNKADNWHSAASSAGFATPGFENSQYSPSVKTKSFITIEPELFSPDNDGYNDILNINYQFSKPGYITSITLYDPEGRIIKKLTNNEMLGIKGSVTWDGVTDDNRRAPLGIYVVYAKAFHPDGDTKQTKKVCVVGGKLH